MILWKDGFDQLHEGDFLSNFPPEHYWLFVYRQDHPTMLGFIHWHNAMTMTGHSRLYDARSRPLISGPELVKEHARWSLLSYEPVEQRLIDRIGKPRLIVEPPLAGVG